MKPKIALIANHDVVIYNFRKELVERLLKEDYEVHLLVPDGTGVEKLRKKGCIVHSVKVDRHGMNPIKDLKLVLTYHKILKKIRPIIVFTYTIKPNIYGGMVCSLLKIPYAVNITGLGTAVENRGIVQKVTLLLYKLALKNVKTVFFQNNENLSFFMEHKIAREKASLLPGSGVNLEEFFLLPYPSGENIEFAFISRIMKEKGIDQYLEAAKCIKQKYPETVFHVCGFCEQAYEGLLSNMQKDGVIIYHGMVQDVKSILQDVHCTIHPTYYPEGISNVLLESLACGRPIITTDRAGCREVVDDGKNGYVVKQKDSVDLVEKIEKFVLLSQEEKKQMGIVGREKVEKEFDRNIVVETYMKEVGDVLGI